MAAMVCELCGSNSFTKVDEHYQCDHCRTKYTTIEARKLLVTGTVKVDRSDDADNLYMLANSAYKSSNYEEAYEYASRALEIAPDNSRAWFIKGASVGRKATPDTIATAAREMEQSFKNGARGLRGDDLVAYQIRSAKVTRSVVKDMLVAAEKTFNDEVLGKRFKINLEAPEEFANRCRPLMDVVAAAYDLDKNPESLKIAIRIAHRIIGQGQQKGGAREALNEKIKGWERIVQREDSNYKAPSNEGCFVVTATFGNENAAPVVLLRQFRDHVLMRGPAGRRFVTWYYQHGPRMAEAIERSWILRGLTFTTVVVPATIIALPSIALLRLHRSFLRLRASLT